MDLILFIKILSNTFSLRRSNMRFFHLKRVVAIGITLPLFLFFLIINRLFLALDFLFFPGFLKMKVKKSIFIVAVPRSGTTFLFHQLAENNSETTCMKLWEILLAPSITQKYLFLLFLKVDDLFKQPFRQFIRLVEKRFFRKLFAIHPFGLGKPEEDEGILIWNLSTIYLSFFLPDSDIFDRYLFFDHQLDEKKRKKVMRFYFRCIQRHNYVFNRDESKFYLSKNPVLCSKIKSLKDFFSNAFILNILRDPGMTIPSTIHLNNYLYGYFTNKKSSHTWNGRLKNGLILWYKMAEKHLKESYPDSAIFISFEKLIKGDPMLFQEIANRTGLSIESFRWSSTMKKENEAERKYDPISIENREQILNQLPFLRERL